jgi:hypothetical protein
MRDGLDNAPGLSVGPMIEYDDRAVEHPRTGGVTDSIAGTFC